MATPWEGRLRKRTTDGSIVIGQGKARKARGKVLRRSKRAPKAVKTVKGSTPKGPWAGRLRKRPAPKHTVDAVKLEGPWVGRLRKRPAPKGPTIDPKKRKVDIRGRMWTALVAFAWRRFALLAQMRRLLIKFARRVRADVFKTVSVTFQPFVYMLSRETGDTITALPSRYRGHAYVRDSAGRYHQQLSETMIELPKIATFGIEEGIVYWNHEHATVTDLPAMQNFLIFKYERVKEAITNFTSPLTAIRFVDIIEAHPNLPYDEMDDENFASEGPLFAYNKHAGSRTRAGGATLDAWLLPPQQELELREDTAVGSSCGYDII